jgi:hypothetical protein
VRQQFEVADPNAFHVSTPILTDTLLPAAPRLGRAAARADRAASLRVRRARLLCVRGLRLTQRVCGLRGAPRRRLGAGAEGGRASPARARRARSRR